MEKTDKQTKKSSGYELQIEGMNFQEVFKYSDEIEINKISLNDIGSILRIYGVNKPK